MQQVCKICKQPNSISYFIESKKVLRCLKCNSIYNEDANEKYPSIADQKNKIKLHVQKQLSKLIAEGYLKYLKLKTNLSFKNAFDIGSGFGHFVNYLRERDNCRRYRVRSINSQKCQ